MAEKTNIVVRDSNMEMLRIFSMFLIVFYHLVCFFVVKLRVGDSNWTAIQPCVHQGVVLFVLISGYYGIKTKIKGILHILLLCVTYYVPISLIFISLGYQDVLFGGGNSLAISILPISKGPYWFVRTYLYLYLLVPMINNYIFKSSRHLVYMLFTTGFISVYMSYFSIDPSLSDGKNIISFVFLYCLGRFIYMNKAIFLGIDQKVLVTIAIALNVSLFIGLKWIDYFVLKNLIYRAFFPYYSLGLIINSIVIFCIFVKIRIRSNFINLVASSMFSVYLIHHQPFLMQYVIQPIVSKVEIFYNGDIWLFMGLVMTTAIVMVCCVTIDLMIKPIFATIEKGILQKMRILKRQVEL